MAMNNLVDGAKAAAVVRAEVTEKVADVKSRHGGKGPTLAMVLVGDRRDSAIYVHMKEKACAECGIESQIIRLPSTVSQAELISQVESLNRDCTVHGILVQLPLPEHIEEAKIIDCIDWRKDVDGLAPQNVGLLALKGRTPHCKPCTAEGAVELCRHFNVNLKGAEVVVVGRSNIVGMPAALLFQQEDATVTICHSRTLDIAAVCRRADIVIAAIGKPHFVKADWIKEGAVVIDVGINSVDDATNAKGYKLVGDVDFAAVQPKCKLITPVPGGVGPMTVAILMKNTLSAFNVLAESHST